MKTLFTSILLIFVLNNFAQVKTDFFEKAYLLFYSYERSEQKFIEQYIEIYNNCIQRNLSTNASDLLILKSKSIDLQNNSKKLVDYFNQLATIDTHFYSKYKAINNEMISSLNQLHYNTISLNMEIDKFTQNQCYSKNQNCNFEEKYNKIFDNLKTSDQVIIKDYLYLLNGLNENLFKDEFTADEIIQNNGILRKLIIDFNQKNYYFYDEIFDNENFTFIINTNSETLLMQLTTIEIDGKELLNGYTYLTIIDEKGIRIGELYGNFYKGRLIGDAKLSLTSGWNNFILNSFFWGIPLSKESVIDTKWGKYTGELKFGIIPHGKGTLERDYGRTVCSGEFKDGIPADVKCTTFNFDTGHVQYKIINGNIVK